MNAPTHNDDDPLVLFGALTVFGGAILGSAGALWLGGVQWLVAHGVLVAAAQAPLLELPYAQGAGLDWARALVLGGVAVALLACAISAARRTLQRRQEIR